MGQGGGGRPRGRERPLETLPQSIRGAEGPCAPAEGGGLADIRRDESYGSKKATGPKEADFVLLYFLGKLLSWLRRGGQAGREPA